MSREGWVVVKDTPTHVRTWGGWIEDKITSDSLIICITGNPGVTGFYSVFLSTLHAETGIPVWVINHAGLEIPPKGESCLERLPSPESTPHLLDLQGQIDHKLKFIQRYAGADDLKLYLVGHSAGAKMLTGLLDRERSLLPRVSHAYLLFPTLEHIAKSPYGKLHVKYGKYFLRITLFLTWVLNCFPLIVRKWVVKSYLRLRRKADPDESILEAGLQLLDPRVVSSALFLARDEMINIKELDTDVLLELGDRVSCYYGEKDGWAPVWQSEDVSSQCPKANVHILDKNYKHAFVLSSPRQVANIISRHLLANRTTAE